MSASRGGDLPVPSVEPVLMTTATRIDTVLDAQPPHGTRIELPDPTRSRRVVLRRLPALTHALPLADSATMLSWSPNQPALPSARPWWPCARHPRHLSQPPDRQSTRAPPRVPHADEPWDQATAFPAGDSSACSASTPSLWSRRLNPRAISVRRQGGARPTTSFTSTCAASTLSVVTHTAGFAPCSTMWSGPWRASQILVADAPQANVCWASAW